MLDQVGNPKDQFSRIAAHIIMYIQCTKKSLTLICMQADPMLVAVTKIKLSHEEVQISCHREQPMQIKSI